MSVNKIASLALLLATVPQSGWAQDQAEETVTESIQELRRAILVRDNVIRNLLGRIEALEKSVADLRGDAAPAATEKPEEMAKDPQVAAEDAAQLADPDLAVRDEEDLPELSKDEKTEQERLVRTAFERALIDVGGLLLPPWTLEAEPSVSYIHSSTDNIVIDGFTILPILVVGDIFSERIRRDLVQGAATFRLGLPWASQMDIRVPFGYQRQATLSADNEETFLSTTDLGDVEFALSHELLRSRSGNFPDLLVNFRWKSTTGGSPFDAQDRLSFGSGFDSFSGSLTAIKVSDPVAYFANFSYVYNAAITEDVGRFNPGDSVGFQLGMAIALNLNAALTFSYEHQFAWASELDGARIPGSALTTGTFFARTSYSITPDISIDFSVGIGVTEDSPDVRINLAVPIRLRF